jgi:predicted RNase H-like HicB family nuclease
MATSESNSKNYLKKPYTRIITPAEEGGFVGEILEFPGCFAEGETPNETFATLELAAESWIEAALEQKQDIPEPADNRSYGGKVALRLPRTIHRHAARLAARDNTSLNQFLVSSIATRVGAEDLYDKLLRRIQREIIAPFQVSLNVWQIQIGSPVAVGESEPTMTFQRNKLERNHA